MLDKIHRRLAADEGFTLIELLVVIIIISILLAIAVPSYLGFRSRAHDSAAKANIRAAVSSAEAYYADNGSYSGMDISALYSIDSGLAPTLVVANVTASSYCLQDAEGGQTWHMTRPTPGSLQTGAC